jgi:CheY-like chemotaxis protein
MAEELGARHFLPKPVLPESLRDLVRWLAGDQMTFAPLEQKASATADLAGLHVLLVEDNPINQQLAVELMESRQVTVTVANNGQEAIECIHAHRPDHFSVVLMDLQMPVMDGYEATRLLRLDARYVGLPIVAMTAHAMADERARCMVLGMNGHVSKPIDPEILYATLAEFNAPGADVRPGPTTPAATRAEPTPVATNPGLPQVAGLDVRSGLHYAGGKVSLYSQLLRQFAYDFSVFAGAFESALNAGNWDDAARQAHTLKGLAASLGAVDLQPRAAALELAARAHEMTQSRANLAQTIERLAPLLSALRLHYGVDAVADSPAGIGRAPQASANGPAGSTTELAAWRRHFRDLLQQADVEARELWEARPGGIDAWLPSQVAHRITQALENFEFDAALGLLPEDPASPGPKPDGGAPTSS